MAQVKQCYIFTLYSAGASARINIASALIDAKEQNTSAVLVGKARECIIMFQTVYRGAFEFQSLSF